MQCRFSALAVLALLLITASASTQIILIESPGCHKCEAAEKTLNGIMASDKSLELVKYLYYSDEGHRIIKEYNAKDVPSVIVGKQAIGYKDYDGNTSLLEGMIKAALNNQSMASSAPASQEVVPQLQSLTLAAMFTVFMAGLLAGFNPCLLGILVFLASIVMSSTRRRRDMLTMITFFSLGIFSVYLIFGLGMQQFVHSGSTEDLFRYALTALLVLLGLSQVEDARRLSRGKGSLFRTDWALKYVEAGAARKSLPAYFLIGALFSLVKAPCVGAVYLAILDLISREGYHEAGAVYLVLYNLGVVLPIVILGGLIALGLSPEQVDRFRKDYRAQIRLITGLSLLILAPLIYWKII
jgi:cytochrome c-type biogenesis protein